MAGQSELTINLHRCFVYWHIVLLHSWRLIARIWSSSVSWPLLGSAPSIIEFPRLVPRYL